MKIQPYFLAAGVAMSCACQQSTSRSAGITDTVQYMRTGHPDTALAIFLYKECYHYDFTAQREEYMRYETDYDVVSKLYGTLWSQRPDYRERLQQLHANQARFVQDARNLVHARYRRDRIISDEMMYAYLLGRKDEELKSLLVTISTDTAAPYEERINAAETLADWQ